MSDTSEQDLVRQQISEDLREYATFAKHSGVHKYFLDGLRAAKGIVDGTVVLQAKPATGPVQPTLFDVE